MKSFKFEMGKPIIVISDEDMIIEEIKLGE